MNARFVKQKDVERESRAKRNSFPTADQSGKLANIFSLGSSFLSCFQGPGFILNRHTVSHLPPSPPASPKTSLLFTLNPRIGTTLLEGSGLGNARGVLALADNKIKNKSHMHLGQIPTHSCT